MLLTFPQTGELVLRRPARALTKEEILSPDVQKLIHSMFETMHAAPGVGLAAPQIGLPLQLAVIEDRASYMEKLPAAHLIERRRAPVPPHAIINPQLIVTGPEEAEFFEGCLSLPGYTAVVRRALRVRVECLNERAEPVTIEAEGWYARILQHEIDHLRGTLYIDRMLTRSFMTRENYERLWKDVPVPEFLRGIGDV
ncbi:MAG TPA: peptide deformylase [Bryobacteraceae bacterium]|jgi:peptide deformylase|nr:peptide deformylase [Bryobacteraceae bacterium]